MKGEVLKHIKPEENKSYVDRFIQLISSSHLSIPDLEQLNSNNEKTIIGQTLEKLFGYKTVLRLKAFEKVDRCDEPVSKNSYRYVKKVWLVTRSIGGNRGLSIGYNNNILEIFQENGNSPVEEYFLSSQYSQPETTGWIKPSQDFLQITLDLLKPEDQPRFRELSSNSIKK
jgi:hypothetical protein